MKSNKYEVDHQRIEKAVREILVAIGEDPDRDGLVDTPARVANLYEEICCGLAGSPADHLNQTFEIEHDEIIIVRDIPLFSICEHHLIPFIGKAHVGYLPKPGGKITGLSKIVRLVDGYARQLQMQERLTTQIANALETKLDPLGAIVVIEAEHLCMSMRGVQKPGANTVTSSVRGSFRENPASRAEVLSQILRNG